MAENITARVGRIIRGSLNALLDAVVDLVRKTVFPTEVGIEVGFGCVAELSSGGIQ